MRRTSIAALLFLLLAGGIAHARGTVLQIDGPDVYIDLGTSDGVLEGTELALLHVIEATHPVTRRKVRDTFRLGQLTVVKAGSRMCIARAPGELHERVRIGDEIELASLQRTWVDPWVAAGAPAPAAPGPGKTLEVRPKITAAERRAAEEQVAAGKAAATAWDRTLGKPPADRIAVWEDYLKFYPEGPYAEAVRQEIASLGAQIVAEKELAALQAQQEGPEGRAELAMERLEAVTDTYRGGPLAWLPPRRVYEGSSFELAFLLARPGAVKTAWVHYRRAGEPTYRRAELAAGGDGYLRQRIPGDVVHPPAVEFFVSVLLADAAGGEPENAIGGAWQPERVGVDRSVEEPPADLRHRSRVSLFLDTVRFGPRDGYLQAEADFMYRFRRPIYALRIGFGTLTGEGGLTDVIDADPGCLDAEGVYACRKVGLNYGYAELDFRLSDVVHVMVRPLVGGAYYNDDPHQSVDRKTYDVALGIRGRVRLGRETETNLTVGASAIDGFGKLLEAAFTWDVIPAFPIVLGAQVTDQPVPEIPGHTGDRGVRLIAEVGWRGLGWMVPSVRISSQARDYDHYGISGGGAVTFDW